MEYMVSEILQYLAPTVVIIAIGVPLARAFARRLDRGADVPPDRLRDMAARLERIEQSVDSVALEVERLAEAQRFAAKLLAERAGDPQGSARNPLTRS